LFCASKIGIVVVNVLVVSGVFFWALLITYLVEKLLNWLFIRV
jgi:hypothetical protein